MEKEWFQNDFHNRPFAHCRLTDPIDRRQSKLLCWLTVHAPKCICALRSTGRLTDCKSFALGQVWSIGPVDQQRVWLSSWELRSTVRSTAIPNGQKSGRWWSTGRLTDRRISFWFFSNGYIMFCLFLGLFLTALLGFLLMFSSPINSGTVKKLNKISKAYI